MILFGLAAWVGVWLATHRLARIPLAASQMAALGILIATLWLAAMCGALRPVTWLAFAAGLGWLTAEIWLLSDRRDKQSPLLRPEILAYLCGCIILWWKLHGAEFNSWDDFGHWGLSSRELLTTDQLPGENSLVMYKDYPPASTLFHYFCLLWAPPSDGNIMTANSWILLLPIGGLLAGFRWYSLVGIIAAVVANVAAIEMLGVGFQTAMVDSLLGVVFAGCLISYFTLREAGGSTLWVAPALFVLPLFKDSGVLLAELAVLIIAVDMAATAFKSGRPSMRMLATVVGLVAAPLIARRAWQWYVDMNGFKHIFPVQQATVAGILHELSGQASDHSKAVRDAFSTALLQTPLDGFHALPVWASLIGAMLLLALALSVERVRVATIAAAMSGAAAVYLFSMLIMYLVLFSPYESLRLASFERYSKTLLLGLFFVTLYMIMRLRPLVPTPLAGVWAGGVVGAMIYLHPQIALLDELPRDPIRQQFSERIAAIRKVTPERSRIWTIVQNSSGGEVVRIRYDLAPRIYTGAWSVGKPYSPADQYTVDRSPEQLGSLAGQAEYLFLARPDRQFWDAYGVLFAPGEESEAHFLYRIVRSTDGKITFAAIL